MLSIGLVPATAPNAKGEEYELHLRVNDSANFSSSQHGSAGSDRLLASQGTGYSPAYLLSLDIRTSTKSQLAILRKEISERRSIALDKDMKNHELLDSIKEAIDDKRSEVEALEHKVRGAEEEYDKVKETTTTEKLASDAQIEKMEKELARMRGDLGGSVQVLEQREINTNIE